MKHMTFCAEYISLSILFSRFTHNVACVGILFLLVPNNIVCIYIGRTVAETKAPILWPPDAKS